MAGGSKRARGGMSWWPMALLLLMVAAVGAGAYWLFARPKAVATVRVERGTVVKAFYATGVVRPDFEYVIKSKAQGALQGLEKREGSKVYKGERLARVDDRQLKYEAERYAAELEEAKKQASTDSPQRQEIAARLTEAKLQTEMAHQNLVRTQTSFDAKAANFTDLDAARRSEVQWANTVAALEGQLGTWAISSQRAVEVAEANLRKAQANLGDADVISPIDGVILERYVENQEVVGINQKVVMIAAPDDMLMKAAVDEEDITRTRIGQKVEMQLYAFQDRDGGGQAQILEGKVAEILPSANPANKTYEVKIRFVDAPLALRVGMTGELNFIEDESTKNDALIVPSSAVLDRKVYRPIGEGALRRYEAVAVKPGIRTLDKVEIVEGLREGELVAADAKQVAPVKLPPQQQPVVPTRTGDNETAQR